MPKSIINEKTYSTLALINFIFAFFVDSMFVYKNFKYSSIETLVYLIVFNVAFVVFAVLAVLKSKKNRAAKLKKDVKTIISEYYPITILAVILAILAIMNFDTTAVYDAHLYYGSFVKSIELFEITAKTAIGAFAQWGHNFVGTALFVAPFECLALGDMVGSYTANTLLFCITLFVFYSYLRDVFKNSNKWTITLAVAIFAFMPYSFNLITYFCPDFYLQLYIIWLLYAYKKDNQIMVSFIGFLLCLTKDSGAFIYGFLILFLFIIDANTKCGIKKLPWLRFNKLPYARFIIWIIPAVFYALNFLLKDKFQMQVFEGISDLPFGINLYDFKIQFLITFVYGFRWIIVALFVLAVIVKLFYKNSTEFNKITKLDIDYRNAFIALALAILALHTMFSMFMQSHCPRYTTPMNVLYTIAFVYSINIIFSNKKVKQTVVSLLVAALLFVQAYVTIDPAIKTLCSNVETGENKVYNLGKTRNAKDGFFDDCIGDFFVYNNEYTVSTDLTKQALTSLGLKNDTLISIYDTNIYEYHISGLQYKLYWDTVKQRQTYTANKNTIYVSNESFYPEERPIDELEDYLVFIIPERKTDSFENYKKELLDAGYTEITYYSISNFYGQANVAIYQKF